VKHSHAAYNHIPSNIHENDVHCPWHTCKFLSIQQDSKPIEPDRYFFVRHFDKTNSCITCDLITSNYTCTEFRLFTKCAQNNSRQFYMGKTEMEQHIGVTMKFIFFLLFYFLPHLFIFLLFFFLSFQCMAKLQFELFRSYLVAKFLYDSRLTTLTENNVICDMN
jgi:hypothetical protein